MAPIYKLPPRIGGIDDFPKGLKKFPIGNFFRPKGHLDALDVSGFSGGNLFVGRIFDGSAGIARYHGNDSGDFLQVGLYTPKAAPRQGGDLLLLCRTRCRMEE